MNFGRSTKISQNSHHIISSINNYFILILKKNTVPSIQIMMNGGMRSMLRMKANLRLDTSVGAPKHHVMPVVVVKDSGRLSSCLVRAMEIFDNNEENVENQPLQTPGRLNRFKSNEQPAKNIQICEEESDTMLDPLNNSQEPVSLLETFDEEAEHSSLKKYEKCEALLSLSRETVAIDKDAQLREYIREQFKPFYYHSSKRTIKYTDEQRKLVFEFVKECAKNPEIRKSVSIE